MYLFFKLVVWYTPCRIPLCTLYSFSIFRTFKRISMFILLWIMNKCSTIRRKLNLCHTKPSITTKQDYQSKWRKKKEKEKRSNARYITFFTIALALTIVILSSFYWFSYQNIPLRVLFRLIGLRMFLWKRKMFLNQSFAILRNILLDLGFYIFVIFFVFLMVKLLKCE